MIFSDCPYCNEPQVFGWECGMSTGYFPSRCPKCKKVMWVKATSFDGETITHEDFKVTVMKEGDEEAVDKAAAEVEVFSNVIYKEGKLNG